MTADERKVFRAIGKAHVATNIPIFTHTGIPGNAALEQLDLLEDAGVKPDKSSSAISATWSMRTCRCTGQCAGAAPSSASIARAALATPNRCRW